MKPHPQDTSHWQNEAHWENTAHRHNTAHWHEPHPHPEHRENPADRHNAHQQWHNAHRHWHNVHPHWHNRARAHWQNPAHWQNAGHLKQAEVAAIVNHGGSLVLSKTTPIFSADGWITQTLESLPYFGFVVAVFRKQSGVEARSGATSAALSVAALVAGAATPPKMLLEQWAGSTLIVDPALRREFAAEAPRRGTYLIETLTNMLAAGSSKQVSQFFAQHAAQLVEALVYPVLQKLGRIVEALVNGAVLDEWLSSPSQLQGNIDRWNRASTG
ncbi:hypothetical protein B0H14DRAFT_3681175 [Mycena olivaceomarginata]|nr:hypothetical protein B0H14DRAFT_3681175 [Mycena olivaceomarginata]